MLFYVMILVSSLLIGTLFTVTYPLIAERKLKAFPALKYSVKAAWANFGGMLGLTVVNSIITALAALCCYVPVVLVWPIVFGANIVAFRKVFPESGVQADVT